MSVPAIVAALKADTVIRSLTSNGVRVYDHEIRRSGWQAHSEVYDADGVVRTSIAVLNAGSTRSAFGHTAEKEGSVTVAIFGPRTDAGRANVATLTERVQVLMHRWQVPETGAFVRPVFEGPLIEDDEGGLSTYVTLQVTSMLAVSNF